MVLTYSDLKVTNLIGSKSVRINFLVDTGAMLTCIPDALARQLGFDPEECPTKLVTVADGRSLEVPRIRPIEIEWDENRTYATEALVLGDQPLLGVIVLEGLDLIVDPASNKVRPPPDRPNFPVYPVY